MLQIGELKGAIAKAATNRSRLIVMCNAALDGLDLPNINLNQQLSDQLLNIPRKDRARSISPLLNSLILQADGDEVVLNGLDILFDRSLAIDPIRLLMACSKTKTLLVNWPGDRTSTGLSYAVPSHPEYRTYKASDLSDAIYLDVDVQRH